MKSGDLNDRYNPFGKELLSQELVTFEHIHVNVSQTLVITTEDKIHLWLSKFSTKLERRREWIAPFGLVISITLALSTSSFNNFIFPSDTWLAIFVLLDVASVIWLFNALKHSRKIPSIKEAIEELKTFSTKLE
ncbi:MAG: hypothetical protein FJ241_09760 [Nitrospira sp.]|nr:hypothetical protein [Nitrospira sp.]